MATVNPHLVPALDDPDTEPFFRAAGEGRLVVRTCDTCGASLHLPRAHCGNCGTTDATWQDVNGTGRVFTWTVVEHQVHPTFPVPYTVVLAELDDRPDVRLMGYLPGRPDLSEGTPVKVRFDPIDDQHALPGWDLVDPA